MFVKTQRTTSPAASEIECGLDSSVQTADVSAQPAGTSSETEYVPGARSPESFDCPSERLKPPSS